MPLGSSKSEHHWVWGEALYKRGAILERQKAGAVRVAAKAMALAEFDDRSRPVLCIVKGVITQKQEVWIFITQAPNLHCCPVQSIAWPLPPHTSSFILFVLSSYARFEV